MYFDGIIEGKYVDLKSVTIEDAEFTRNIRRDPEFSSFFPKLDNTLEQQKEWIKKQQKKKGDYFFVVWDKKGNRIGTIALYDVSITAGETGRLAIKGNALQSIEAQLLIFNLAFNQLHLNEVIGYIFADNERAIRFNKQFGANIGEPQINENGHIMVKASFAEENVKVATKTINRILYR